MTTRSKVALGLALALAGCATVKAPTLQVQGLTKGKVGITGARLDVIFGVRGTASRS